MHHLGRSAGHGWGEHSGNAEPSGQTWDDGAGMME